MTALNVKTDDDAVAVAAAELIGISKTYGATRALQDVSVTIPAGQTHGLVGRNGAGKSTLVKILTGMEIPDRGRVLFSGEEAPPPAARDEWLRRVACVYQRPSVFANLTVMENLFVNRQPVGVGPAISWTSMRRRSVELLDEWGLDVDPGRLLAELPLEQRQLVQIARALSTGSRLVLLDEPTVQLDGHAISQLFEKLDQLKARGVTFVLVSHFLKEIKEACDAATVLRDGQLLWTRRTADIDQDQLVEAVLASQVQQRSPRKPSATAMQPSDRLPRLRLEAATDAQGLFRDVSLEIAPGEIVAVGGLGGSGKYALGEAVAGLRRISSGGMVVDGRRRTRQTVGAAQAAGIGYVPADRHKDGYVPQLSVAENMTMSVMARFSRFGFFRPSAQTAFARQMINRVSLVPPDPALAVSGLSGGNQQKVVLGRALADNPALLVLVSPTAGVDIAAKDTIYAFIDEALAAEVSVLLISDDVEELMISERILIMRNGLIATELTSASEENIVRAIEDMELP